MSELELQQLRQEVELLRIENETLKRVYERTRVHNTKLESDLVESDNSCHKYRALCHLFEFSSLFGPLCPYRQPGSTFWG